MEPEDSLKMWTERVLELEDALQEAIKVIKVLQKTAQWSGAERDEIQRKIDKFEDIYLPF